MPTFDVAERFARDLTQFDTRQRRAFDRAVSRFVAGLKAGQMPPGLRVKGLQAAPGVFELTWAPDGQATFSYGAPVVEGQAHVVWRRVGTHAIFGMP